MPEHRHGGVLGFDFGLKRIGVAVGDLEIGLAHPLETIYGEVNTLRFKRIAELIEQWQPVLAVVGIPSHDDERPHVLAVDCQRFARRLQGRFGLSVVGMDERYSSTAASQTLHENGVRGVKQKVMIDQVAAQHILQQYFNESECARAIA